MHVMLTLEETDLKEVPWIHRTRREVPHLRAPELRDDVRKIAIQEWEERARAEYIGVMIVRRFHGLLVDLNAPMDLQELALAMMVQEQQHSAMCMQAARSLGSEGELSFPLDELQQARSHESEEVQLLKMLATTFMVGEGTAFALLKHTMQSLPESGYREILKQILRDEVIHSRIGQTVLGWLKGQTECAWARYPGDDTLNGWVAEAVADLRRRDVVEAQTAEIFDDEVAAKQLPSVGISDSRTFRDAYLQALRVDIPQALSDLLSA
ncbi:MAG TPA: hypothetical protein DCQ06_11675 [Myxococcales bacterium]|nr:hypothetical protein [Myxococcales bacterium]HAN32247.1 hypothetical protein [Myxococcales bacterium]